MFIFHISIFRTLNTGDAIDIYNQKGSILNSGYLFFEKTWKKSEVIRILVKFSKFFTFINFALVNNQQPNEFYFNTQL